MVLMVVAKNSRSAVNEVMNSKPLFKHHHYRPPLGHERNITTMSHSKSNPEVYWTKPSLVAPNSRLPILVYRNVVPVDASPEELQQIVESNNWIKGGTWGHIGKPHYHSNTHECYVPIAGWTKCLYGSSLQDDPKDGVRFEIKVGDVEVHPAGMAHCHVESSDDYRYLGLYPKVRISKYVHGM